MTTAVAAQVESRLSTELDGKTACVIKECLASANGNVDRIPVLVMDTTDDLDQLLKVLL